MIIVKIELHPADGSAVRELGVIKIFNDMTGTDEVGNYEVELYKAAEYAQSKGVWKRGVVKGFPRHAGRGPYDLLFVALRNTVGFRNK